ncbi:DMT family transporter [Actinoplanes lobatus]|uniref:Drug/metabolite transporter (DMT)-like permease n=2 Tax=Actinoplanes lobatus TaxID=113568 RepID=A0A7W7HP80_9ACTN|nr:DMT family transporter [Actinoplanes lobatus]MBB4753967.1 drug/metabolite transporter (DMT)-like permease [Actinoplanes lobatus]
MGPLLCLLSAACFGAMAIFGKFAYQAGVSPSALLLVRFSLAAVLLTALAAPPLRVLLTARAAQRVRVPLSALGRTTPRPGPRPGVRVPLTALGRTTPRPGPRPGVRVLLTALALGAIGYATQATLYFEALRVMDASLLSLIFYTYPLLVTVVAVLLGRDRLTPGRVLALLAASGGTLLVLLGTGGVAFRPLGAVLAFGSALTYTVYILVSDRVVHALPPLPLSALVMTGAAAALAGKSLATGGVDLAFTSAGWFWLACIVVVSTILAMLTFFAGLRRTGPSTAAILSTFEPVVTTALAALTLGESLTALQLLGGLLVLSSAAALQLRPAPPAAAVKVRSTPSVASDFPARAAAAQALAPVTPPALAPVTPPALAPVTPPALAPVTPPAIAPAAPPAALPAAPPGVAPSVHS